MARLGGDQRRDVVFALRVEAERPFGDLLAEDPVGPDDLLAAQRRPRLVRRRRGLVDDEQMIADRVVGILIAPAQLGAQRRDGRHLLVENLVAQLLGELDVAPPAGQPHLEGADLAVDLVRLA